MIMPHKMQIIYLTVTTQRGEFTTKKQRRINPQITQITQMF
ncbi:MAG: hypothetical protein V1749_01340 [Candidatus Desantisbacteria bacterium]